MRLFWTQTMEKMGDSIFDIQAVPSSLAEVVPILRVAKEVEPGNVRVAYLFRFYAFEKAHSLDPRSTGRGVRLFKTALLQSLERANPLALKWRREESESSEIQQFYLYFYKKFIKKLQNAVDKAGRRYLLTGLYQTEAVLFDALRAVNGSSLTAKVDQAILKCTAKSSKIEKCMLLTNRCQRTIGTAFFKNTPEEISDSEGSNDSSTSDNIGLIDISRDRSPAFTSVLCCIYVIYPKDILTLQMHPNTRMDTKCMIPNLLDETTHKGSADPISIPFGLLQDITQNFADERKIGQGGFVVVYKGVLQSG